MTTTLLCYWCNDLTDPERGYVPLGVLVREGVEVALRIKRFQELPAEQQPQDKFMKSLLDPKNIEHIFERTTEATRGQPLSLHFAAVSCDQKGTVEEKAEALFEIHVTKYYQK
ncbi:hypothetical protein J4210_02715 [Candidatus Woesearchaeota archaeon]|nr:hypothetical protein [uncultured archaeon]MBS3169373.1 hypothetical protein [Candidatus Woesearchaeota archaeon]